VSAEAIAVIREFEDTASTAGAVYAASTARTRGLLTEAAAALDVPTAWLPEPTRKALGEQFSVAVKLLGSRATRSQALEGLSRLTRLAEVVRRVDALDDSPATKKVRAAAAQAIALPAAQTDPTTLDAVIRLLKLAAARSTWGDEKALIRQLRPGWKVAVNAAKQSEQHLLTVLPEVLRKPEAMTDPATLSAVTAHRRAVEDVQGLLDISRAFEGPGTGGGEPTAAPAWTHAADRVMKVCQELASPAKRDVAHTFRRAGRSPEKRTSARR
jgi:hypothetical protein